MVAVTLPRGHAIISTLTRATTLTSFRQLYSLLFLKVFMLLKVNSLPLLRLNYRFFNPLRRRPSGAFLSLSAKIIPRTQNTLPHLDNISNSLPTARL